MRIRRWFVIAVAVATMATIGGGSHRLVAADGYGSVTGQFVIDGDIPVLPPFVEKGKAVQDPAVCAAAADIPDDTLVVDPESKGIQHIFVYLPKATAVHPDLKASKAKEVVFDQKGCQFTPHTLLVRTDQTVLVKSGDACPHNTHTFPVRGMAVNFILQPNDRTGVPVPNKVPEVLPSEVKCDIHRWMSARWLILDHPYAAITDAKGKFTIADLPEGEHVFRVWQERVGYVNRELKVTVESGKTKDIGVVKVPADKFKK
jgi:hypothetical protein